MVHSRIVFKFRPRFYDWFIELQKIKTLNDILLQVAASQPTATAVSADTQLPTRTPVTTTDTSSQATAAHSTGLDSKSSTLGPRKPLPSRDVSSYDRYTRLSYAPVSSSSSSAHSSSYSSASTSAPRTYTGSSIYDRYARPTTSSSASSRYSSSASSSKTSSYLSRYSKK